MAWVDQFDGYIFDYGGVLVFQQTPEEITHMSSVCGLSPKLFEKLYWVRRLEYDLAVLTAADYWTAVAAQGGRTLSADQIRDLIDCDNRSWMHFDEPMWEWVGQLRADGKRTAILSNMPRDLGVALKTGTRRFDDFQHTTLSCEVGVAKPDPAIYEHCLAGLGTAPERTLFLDDRIANVRGAEAVGLQALHFTSRDQLLMALSAE